MPYITIYTHDRTLTGLWVYIYRLHTKTCSSRIMMQKCRIKKLMQVTKLVSVRWEISRNPVCLLDVRQL